ncbi:uncharacterized protein [Halyomorpha halys]|uniref:uncharacterized protein n=1 Tax=Halyomorpha halys TaxID=286706 RepID=UPI0006D4EC15|nr:uncharacterized protein LOC106691292 [Halyomorpha halys]
MRDSFLPSKDEMDIERSSTTVMKNKLVEYLKSLRPRREPNRVRQVTLHNKMMHQSCYEKPVSYYFTSGRKIRCPRLVETESSPYTIDSQRRVNEQVHLDYIKTLPHYLKPSRRDKPVIGINDRIYIPDEDPLYTPKRTVTDNAPDYFKMIIGSPIEEAFFNKEGYISRLKKTFYIRLKHAINEEVILVNEEQKLRELHYLVRIRNETAKMLDSFNEYLKKNLEELQAVTDVAVKMAKLVEVKAIQIVIANGTLDNIKDCLFQMDKVLSYRRVCKITLDELAPELWRREYAKEKDKLQPIADKAADYVLQMLAYFKLEIPFPEETLEKVVLCLANTIRNLGPPARYFKQPIEVQKALKKLEHSTVISIQALEKSSSRRDKIMEQDRKISKDERKSLNVLRTEIEVLKYEFSKRMAPIITIEEETGVIMSYWRAVATNPDLLQAFVHIKCLYDEFVGDESPTKDIVEMISLLTEKIINTQMKVNSLPEEETRKVYDEIRSKDDIDMHNALVARKLKIESERMLKKMNKRFEKRIGHPGLPQQYSRFPKKKRKGAVDTVRPITPPDKRALKKILRIFQPTISQEAYINFLDSIKRMGKVEEELKVVQYPPDYPEMAPLHFSSPPHSSSTSYKMIVDPGDSDTPSNIPSVSADADSFLQDKTK